jgi:hypothetical protein
MLSPGRQQVSGIGPLTDTQLRASNVEVTFGDSAALDAFQRLRTSQANRIFDSQQEYGLDTLRTWDCTANGTLPTILAPNGSVVNGSNAVGPTSTNSRMTPITVSTTNGDYSILQSRQYTRYIPGFSHLILQTGVFASGSNWTAKLVRRTSTSGSPVEEEVTRLGVNGWNIDQFDGTGPSGITLDLTKTQILFTAAQWLGVGRVIMGFDINGRLWPAHQFLHANVLTLPYTQTFNLPVRYEIRNTGAAESKARCGYFDHANGFYLETVRAAAGGTIQYICCSVQSEGADQVRGFPQSQNPGITAIAVTTRRPVFSIRPSATFSGITNRGHIDIEDYWLTASSNGSIYEIVIGGTLTGAAWLAVGGSVAAGAFIVGVRYKILTVGTTDYTLIGASANTIGVSFVATGVGVGTGTATPENSIAEYDSSATAIVGGGVVVTGEVLTGGGSVRGLAAATADFRNPTVLSKIDALAATQLPVTIVCTSTSGTSNVRAGMNWHEQVI